MTSTQIRTIRYYGISLSSFEALLVLSEKGALDMTRLAEELGVSTATATGVAERLVRDGYIRRASRLGDRRTVEVALTETGRQRIYQVTGRFPEPVTA